MGGGWVLFCLPQSLLPLPKSKSPLLLPGLLQKNGFWSQTACIQILTLSFTSHVMDVRKTLSASASYR